MSLNTLLRENTAKTMKSSSPQSAQDRLAVALDVPNAQQALDLVARLDGTCRWFKVGMELYYTAGNAFVETLRKQGFQVFLDLKLHDIPNTVAGAVRSVTTAGASLLTIHASGGPAMMAAAAEAACALGSPRLLAVTVLTSMDASELSDIGVASTPADQVLRLALLAQSAGIHGMVCSPEEVAILRAETHPDTMLVIPGIRPVGSDIGDQKRISTPAETIARGASMLVVGRPISRAVNPAAAAQAILDEIAQTSKP
jgi:orotidine-5'-phosphate decarboxylase